MYAEYIFALFLFFELKEVMTKYAYCGCKSCEISTFVRRWPRKSCSIGSRLTSMLRSRISALFSRVSQLTTLCAQFQQIFTRFHDTITFDFSACVAFPCFMILCSNSTCCTFPLSFFFWRNIKSRNTMEIEMILVKSRIPFRWIFIFCTLVYFLSVYFCSKRDCIVFFVKVTRWISLFLETRDYLQNTKKLENKKNKHKRLLSSVFYSKLDRFILLVFPDRRTTLFWHLKNLHELRLITGALNAKCTRRCAFIWFTITQEHMASRRNNNDLTAHWVRVSRETWIRLLRSFYPARLAFAITE